ncbi:alpha/beta hydrolase [Algibacter aquimarinus]|uniref:Alpha/beta hydrolase n=1 Tax=Algibacter aquimarinus TaxID=1136748 RepID=A0ABP9HJA4_9FLAO
MNLQHKGIYIYFSDTGSGSPVILLHGFLENSNMWQPFIPTISKNNRVICIDLLGHGKTECLGYIHSMELMAEAVEAVLKYLKITKATFVGHSMGGYVVLAFAEKNPDKISGICLMNSTAEADCIERKQNRDRAIALVKENHERFVKMGIVNLFRPKNRTLFSEEINKVISEALKTPVQGIIAALEGMKIRKSREHILKDSALNKIMMISKKDPVLIYSSLINQAKKTNTKIIEFPDGHMCHIENKNDFLQKLMHFIENI